MTLIHLLDASAAASMFSDTAKTTPIVNGATVAAWVPHASSAVAIDALQSTASKRPTYNSNYSASGYPALVFDGSDDELQVVHNSGFVKTAYDLVCVVTPIANFSQKLIFAKLTSAGWDDGFNIGNWNGILRGGSPNFNYFADTPAVFVVGTRVLIWLRCKLNEGLQYISTASSSRTMQLPAFGAAASCSSTSPYSIGGTYNNTGGFVSNMALHEVQIHECDESVVTFQARVRALEEKWGLRTASSVAKPSHPMYQQVIG